MPERLRVRTALERHEPVAAIPQIRIVVGEVGAEQDLQALRGLGGRRLRGQQHGATEAAHDAMGYGCLLVE